MKLSKNAESAYFKQDYSSKPVIDGVVVKTLRRFNDDGGSFTELARVSSGKTDDFPEFEIRQINYSEMEPGVVKAFHLHRRQTDIWYIPPSDKMLLVLIDLREDSPTCNTTMRLVLGDGNSRLVFIPPGVAHGCKNISTRTARIIYFNDVQFSPDPDECDEGRVKWDFVGTDIWEVEKG